MNSKTKQNQIPRFEQALQSLALSQELSIRDKATLLLALVKMKQSRVTVSTGRGLQE